MRGHFLPRPLHPYAWWGYALALAAVANFTTNPLLLGTVVAVVCLVTFARRGESPWAAGFRIYLALGAMIVLLRIGFRVLFGGGDGPTILFHLPEIPLPAWVGGIRLLGPVSMEAVLAGFYDGARLATMVICIGAANSLVNPKRLLNSLPAALYEVGTVLVVAVGVFPQLGDSVMRVARARRLRRNPSGARGRRQRMRVVQTIIVPVLSDALERSMRLAASMDARGYGRSGGDQRSRQLSSGLALLTLAGFGLTTFLVLGGGSAPVAAAIGLASLASAGFSFRLAGRSARRTVYRPIRWRAAETLTVASGLTLLVIVFVISRSPRLAILYPRINPFQWPELTPALLLGVAVAALPAFLTPPPALPSTADHNLKESVS